MVKAEEEAWLRDYVAQVLSTQAYKAPAEARTRTETAETREEEAQSASKPARQMSMVQLADAFNCGNYLSNVICPILVPYKSLWSHISQLRQQLVKRTGGVA